MSCYGKYPKPDNYIGNDPGNYCNGYELMKDCKIKAETIAKTKEQEDRKKAVVEQLATASLSDLQKAQKALQEFHNQITELNKAIIRAFQPVVEWLNEIVLILAETIRQDIMEENVPAENIADSYEKVRNFSYEKVRNLEKNMYIKINNMMYYNGERFLVGECPICKTIYPKKFADQLVDNPKLCYKCKGLERCKEKDCNGILVLRKKWKEPMKKVCEKCGSIY